MRTTSIIYIIIALAALIGQGAREAAAQPGTVTAVDAVADIATIDLDIPKLSPPDSIDLTPIRAGLPKMSKGSRISIYELPYSLKTKSYNWPRLWVNTGVLVGAYVGTLVVLECLPEDATTWNRAALQKVPFQKRWFRNVFKRGPEWDHDNPIFNYVLHPYAGAAYFMAARSCGFNFYQSLLYSAIISTVGWEFGIEACMERPSIQDIFVTPLVGSVIGELFYKLKRHIVSHDYRLFGSPVIGNIVAFLIDPVNEIVGYIGGNDARKLHLGRNQPAISSTLLPTAGPGSFGFSLTCTF
ncbi:MAG: DUF3943 domain-containing protein [Muribaculaceae bacterium]|nr:DUF3943 domain-containing protein [Muribaculaceae bacterium]